MDVREQFCLAAVCWPPRLRSQRTSGGRDPAVSGSAGLQQRADIQPSQGLSTCITTPLPLALAMGASTCCTILKNTLSSSVSTAPDCSCVRSPAVCRPDAADAAPAVQAPCTANPPLPHPPYAALQHPRSLRADPAACLSNICCLACALPHSFRT